MADNAQRMTDNPESPRPGVPQRKPGSLLVSAVLFLLDAALTILLFVMPFCTFGAYWNFILPVFIVGVLYLIVRIILKNVKQTHTTDICFIILRIIGVSVAVIYYGVLLNFGDYFSWFYPVRKTAYINGNYSAEDAPYFDFLPDNIPAKADKYFMHFIPPVAAPDAPENIEIRFYTNKAGTDEMRAAAVQKGAVISDSDDLTYIKVLEYCREKNIDVSGAEVYEFDSYPNVLKAYVISEDTGFCMVYWLR